MIINILTLFPEMFEGVFSSSILRRAQKNKVIKINIFNLRDWGQGRHKVVDDTPYGGGAGMLLKPDVIDNALCALKSKIKNQKSKSNKIILLSPKGKIFDQKTAKRLAKVKEVTLICGHYEGFDERVRKLVDEEISIGQYVLTGGEIPAMAIIDAVCRLIPGVLGKNISHQEESFSMEKFACDKQTENCKLKIENLKEFPQYTRPETLVPKSVKFKKPLKVPKILLSGNHQKIKKWRLEQVVRPAQKHNIDKP